MVEGMERREKRELHPKWEAEEDDDGGKERHDKSSHTDNESDACKLLKRLDAKDVRTSAFKIMTKVRRLMASTCPFCASSHLQFMSYILMHIFNSCCLLSNVT